MKNKIKTSKKAFTLIELLIVIAIIGILFVVLVSKVDFATDKAKATGVQTMFRSYQMAFETISRENAGFASLGWDTGDENGNRKRDSYDEGDTNKNNIMESTETWTGHKVPGETWTGTYTLVNPYDNTDKSAFKLLEDKINSNLDPYLHITIIPDTDASGKLTGNATIAMANSARDPWGNEYHGVYITNAVDKVDRGAIIIYSNGANGQWGSEHDIANGKVSINVPGNNINGKDDYAMSVFYTYANGYGENAIITTGFSNNQKFLCGNNSSISNNVSGGGNNEPILPNEPGTVVLPNGNIIVLPEGTTDYEINDNGDGFTKQDISEKPSVNIDEIKPNLFSFNINQFSTNIDIESIGKYVEVPYEITKVVEKELKCSDSGVYIAWSTNGSPITDLLEGYMAWIATQEGQIPKYIIYRQYETMHNMFYVENNQKVPVLNGMGYVYMYQEQNVPSLEDLIYAAALRQNGATNSNATNECTYPLCQVHSAKYNIAEWNGSEYIDLNLQDEINAVTEFTEVVTETQYRREYIAGSMNVNYTCIPLGTFQAEEGMTWNEWIASDYNTLATNKFTVSNSVFETIDLNSTIDPDGDYCFIMASVQGKWQFNEQIVLPSQEISESVSFLFANGATLYGIICLPSGDFIFSAGLFPIRPYKTDSGWTGDEYRTIDFGENIQYVSYEFYEWFSANAHPVS